MDVISLLLKRAEFGFNIKEKDLFLDEIVKSGEDEVAIISTENGFRLHGSNVDNLTILFSSYKLKGMFNLKNPYANTNTEVGLYIFSKKYDKDILYGIYRENLRGRVSRVDSIELWPEFPEEYYDYIDNVEKYIESGKCPSDTGNQEFGTISRIDRTDDQWNPDRFNKTAVKIREKLKTEKTVVLCDVADIIQPRSDPEHKRTTSCFTISAWKYPIDYTKLREGVMTNTVLRKGDIVFAGTDKLYLLADAPEQELYVSPSVYVIRPNTICPEYLYLYLKSDTAQVIMNSISTGSVIRRINRRDMENIRIIIPKKDDDYYKQVFRVENYAVNDIAQFNSIIQKLKAQETNNIEEILDSELVRNLKTYKSDVMEKFLTDDFNELNICYRNKAYKAALILAGSILEAVLIDWLSEIDDRNYFDETYYSKKDGKEGTLAIYIRDIKYIKRPNWMKAADKAYAIKDYRNKVHAKLCIKGNNINENICRQVIGYLEDVLKTRKGKMIKR